MVKITLWMISLAMLMSDSAQALSRQDVEPLVLQHYPTELVNEWKNATGLEDLDLLPRGFQFLVDDFDGTGTETIFVAYQNSRSVRVAMLDLEGNLLATHDPLPQMRGHSVNAESLDFTGDGFGDIALLIQGGVNLNSREKNFVLAWDGADFDLLTPMTSAYGKTYPAISGASYLDIDGDGVYEIYDEQNREAKTILRYFDGSFQPTSEVAAFLVFKSSQGRQELVSDEFVIEDPTLEYSLYVFNGVDEDKPAVSGSVKVNGIEILNSGTLNATNRFIEAPLFGLQGENTISMEAFGDPDAVVVVMVERFLLVEGDDELRVPAESDTMLRENQPNRNEGTNPSLFVKGKGEKNNRALVSFDLSGIDTNFVSSAVVSLSIVGDVRNWGKKGVRTMSIHPLLEDFSEGNGMRQKLPKEEKFKGEGKGATWNCAVDSNIKNKLVDCNTPWDGGFIGAESNAVVHVNGMAGTVDFDVYQDVLDGHSSWLIKKTDEDKGGRILYFSREGASLLGDSTLAPTLVLTFGFGDGGGDDCNPEFEICEPDCTDPELCGF